jgi:hypothetical protein
MKSDNNILENGKTWQYRSYYSHRFGRTYKSFMRTRIRDLDFLFSKFLDLVNFQSFGYEPEEGTAWPSGASEFTPGF